MARLAGAPFQLDVERLPLISRACAAIALPLIEWILAFRDLNNCHARVQSLDPANDFAQRALETLEIELPISQPSLECIPNSGPLIVVANHPFGALDGTAMLALLKRRRPDVKILANHLLNRIPELRDNCFFVDPFGGAGAKKRNLTAMRAAIRFVKQGGALAVFPAGEVSSLHLRDREVSDIPWNSSLGALVRRTGAAVLPIYFAGRNSDAFQLAGLISPRLRTLMLPRELLKKRGTQISLEIGSVIPHEKLVRFESNSELAAYLRVRTYLLGGRSGSGPATARVPQITEPIAPEEKADEIEAELGALPASNTLATSGSFRAIYATYDQVLTTMREIGRLREITFRAVGEGTGGSRDIDRFDEKYLHLFVWDENARRIVGAYRLGLTDVLAKTGLYTHSLFNYRDELLKQINPAIELGRSFVRQEYQKEYAPLMLLWKGIATFVARQPTYKNLIGPVTISNDYSSFTKQLLIEFLKINTPASDDLQHLISPRNPPRFPPGRSWATKLAATIVRSLEGIDELVGEIESDRTGVPVLLRQYLKLNAKLLGFNVDPEFGGCLDGLMLCDLTQVAPAVLARYMGRSEAASFLAFHRQTNLQ